MKKDYDYYLNEIIQHNIGLYGVPEGLRTPELCKLAINYCGYALESVPLELKTPELCEIAVNRNGYFVLKWVPGELKTFELYDIAYNDNTDALEFVPEKFKTLLKIKYSS